MHIFSKNRIYHLLFQAGLALSAITTTLQAKPMQPPYENSMPKITLPDLLLSATLGQFEVKIQGGHSKKDSALKKTIALIRVLAHESHDKQEREKLKELAEIAETLRFAIKSKTVTKQHAVSTLNLIDATCEKFKKQHAHHASSSSIGKDIFRTLRKLKSDLKESVDLVLTEGAKIAQALSCSERIAINSLPVTISASGNYCITQDLALDTTTAAAITVTADDVDIDFGNHVVSVNNQTTAIFALGVSNFSVHHGTISCSTPISDPNSAGILLFNVENGSFEEMIFTDTTTSSASIACTDLSYVNCQFDINIDTCNQIAAIFANGTNGLTIENCTFTELGNNVGSTTGVAIWLQNASNIQIHACRNFSGIPINSTACANSEISSCEFNGTVALSAPQSNVEMRNCQSTNNVLPALFASGYENILVEDCTFTATPTNDFSLVYLLEAPGNVIATGFIARNCSFISPQANPEFDNIFILGSIGGALFENCIFDSNPSGDLSYPTPANIQIAGPSNASGSNVLVRNSVFRNSAYNHVRLESSSNIALDNCLIDGASSAGVSLVTATTCTVKNCEITNCGSSGISLSDGSQFCELFGNSLLSNAGDGITIDAISTNNIVTSNYCFNNRGNGINSIGAPNEFYNNAACGNGTSPNCSGIPALVLRTPGSPAVTGGNICCP
ncbi:MAG: right-handed parallel beta-helix repeat-containing protein [Verrucomicrobia bacterium]|nr:right-handed parallel beta-helix repeat-containing protein [Verrucomicrobiota bacterium]